MSTIFVSWASGYMASWIVRQLLVLGHRVHGTVRNLQDISKNQHLIDMQSEFPDQLFLFEADLTRSDGFIVAMEWCEYVIHTASPYFLTKSKDPEKELFTPALEWTRNVLRAANFYPQIKKVVLTSSMVTLYNNACDIENGILTENGHNDNTDSMYNSYAYSKTIAEDLAWKMQKEQSSWELVTIHPGAIFWPSLSKRVEATSIGMLRDFIDGSFATGVPELYLWVVDVRDVAEAHVRAIFSSEVHGRYLIVSESKSLLEIGKSIDIAHFWLPDKLPKKQLPKWFIWLIAPFIGMDRVYVSKNVWFPIWFNTKRSREILWIKYIPVKTTLHDHLDQLKRDNLI